MIINSCTYQRSMHCDEEDLAPDSGTCGVCSGRELVGRGDIQDSPVVTLRTCEACGATGASRMPLPSVLDAYYSGYYRGSRLRTTMPQPDRIVRRIVDLVPDRGGIRILDLGGGDGSVALALASRVDPTAEITVVDRAVTRSPDDRLRSFTDLAEMPAGDRFDVVIASAVLEHIPSPLPVLEELIGRMEVDGVLYVRTPHIVPLMLLLRRVGITMDFTFPGHLYDMGPRFWNGLAGWLSVAQQLEVVTSRPSPIETTLAEAPIRTLAAAVLKAPHRILGPRWPFVGGWEFVARRRRDGDQSPG